MPHGLMEHNPLNAIGSNLIMITLRYQCTCIGGEVLNLSTVFDLNMTEEQFVWTMQRQWRDMKIEIEQHSKRGREKDAASN